MLSCVGEYPFGRGVSRLVKSAKYSLLSFVFMVCTARSTSTLDCSHSGDDGTCSYPQSAANSLNSVDANCGLLSVIGYRIYHVYQQYWHPYIQDIFQHRLNSNLPQAGNCDLYGWRSLPQLIPKVYPSWAWSFLFETLSTCRSSAPSSRCHMKARATRRKRLHFTCLCNTL